MKALLLIYIIGGHDTGNIQTIPVSDIETCKVAGELISNDLKTHVRKVAFRCVFADVPYKGGSTYIKRVSE